MSQCYTELQDRSIDRPREDQSERPWKYENNGLAQNNHQYLVTASASILKKMMALGRCPTLTHRLPEP